MKPRIWIAIVVVASAGAFLLFKHPSTAQRIPPVSSDKVELHTNETPLLPASSSPEQVTPSAEDDENTITNYDECIARGNPPLPDASDKCLTKSGHVFIQGVVE